MSPRKILAFHAADSFSMLFLTIILVINSGNFQFYRQLPKNTDDAIQFYRISSIFTEFFENLGAASHSYTPGLRGAAFLEQWQKHHKIEQKITLSDSKSCLKSVVVIVLSLLI